MLMVMGLFLVLGLVEGKCRYSLMHSRLSKDGVFWYDLVPY